MHSDASRRSGLWIGVLLLSACTDLDDPPLYVDTAYQVRCLRCEPRAPDDDERDINAIDGERGLRVSCNVNASGEQRILNFSVEHADYRLEIFRFNLDASGPGGTCTVAVEEGANTYEGDCTDDDPEEDTPCQIELEEESGIVSGTLRCENIPNRADPNITRHVVSPGTSDEPVELEIHGCRGL